MYHMDMTIKRRLFFSNIRMIVLSFMTFVFTVRMVASLFFGADRPSPETIERIRESYSQNYMMTIWLLIFAVFLIIVSIVNNFYTHRMTKKIMKPLVPLNNGVRQIHNNNFSYRIEYKENDEFRPVCDAFDEMATMLEISNTQRAKDEANRRELIAGISHDLKTPLTSIKGYIEGIETGVAATPEMKEKYLSIIKNKTADMEHIIKQLFLFSKLDMDEFPLSLRKVDIGLAISDMIEDSASEYERRGLSIKLSEMPKNIYVNADVQMFRNVIINILENSVKYKTLDQGQMEISIICNNDSVLLRMADNGPGIKEDMLPKIFDVFYRTDPSRNKQGSGLGLAISVKIIERMGGTIYAEPSVHEPFIENGLAIIIKLPLLQEETA